MKEAEFDFVELFGGICGFLQGFLQAGWKFNNHYYSEIDKHAIAVTKYNFKNSIHVGPVEHITGNQLSRNAIFTFGSPCQDFSIAGHRAGMEGERSSLIGEAIRLIDATRPPVFVWENVKGAYSSNQGRDFQAILREFTNLGGYRLEWQLLNTDWVLPQNRERIYLVGHLAGRSFPGIFPFTENDRLFNQQVQTNSGWPQAQHRATTLKSSGAVKADDTFISTCLNGSSAKMVATDTYIETKIKQLSQLDNFDGNSTKQQDRVYDPRGKMACLSSSRTETKVNILIQPVITPDYKTKTQNGQRIKEDGKPSFILDCNAPHGIMITETKEANNGDSINLKALTSQTQRAEVGKGKTHTLDTDCNQAVMQKSTIRRLTEIECERLQGFPDNWTKTGIYMDKAGKEVIKKVPKTQRYKMCGNAVTTDIVELIALRLKDCLTTP